MTRQTLMIAERDPMMRRLFLRWHARHGQGLIESLDVDGEDFSMRGAIEARLARLPTHPPCGVVVLAHASLVELDLLRMLKVFARTQEVRVRVVVMCGALSTFHMEWPDLTTWMHAHHRTGEFEPVWLERPFELGTLHAMCHLS